MGRAEVGILVGRLPQLMECKPFVRRAARHAACNVATAPDVRYELKKRRCVRVINGAHVLVVKPLGHVRRGVKKVGFGHRYLVREE